VGEEEREEDATAERRGGGAALRCCEQGTRVGCGSANSERTGEKRGEKEKAHDRWGPFVSVIDRKWSGHEFPGRSTLESFFFFFLFTNPFYFRII
jgi:hypothetical protein